MATARRELGLSGLILEPTLRHDHCAVAGEDGIDLGHIGVADLPAERAEVFTHFGRRAEADQCRANDRAAWAARLLSRMCGLMTFEISVEASDIVFACETHEPVLLTIDPASRRR